MAILLSMVLLRMLRYAFVIPLFWSYNLFTQNFPNFAQAALDHLSQRSDIDTSRIVVFGRSLGGAVGAGLTKNNPDKVPPGKLCVLTFMLFLVKIVSFVFRLMPWIQYIIFSL